MAWRHRSLGFGPNEGAGKGECGTQEDVCGSQHRDPGDEKLCGKKVLPPQEKREAVDHLVSHEQLSTRKVCKLAGMSGNVGVLLVVGFKIRTTGSSSVVIVDGTSVSHNSIADIRSDMPISVANLKVHIMTRLDIFDINSREFTGAALPVPAT